MAQIGDSIMWAIKNGDLDQVKELIEQNSFNVNQEITTRSPIHYAADYGQADVLKYLICKGADVNVSETESHIVNKYLGLIMKKWRGSGNFRATARTICD